MNTALGSSITIHQNAVQASKLHRHLRKERSTRSSLPITSLSGCRQIAWEHEAPVAGDMVTP